MLITSKKNKYPYLHIVLYLIDCQESGLKILYSVILWYYEYLLEAALL